MKYLIAQVIDYVYIPEVAIVESDSVTDALESEARRLKIRSEDLHNSLLDLGPKYGAVELLPLVESDDRSELKAFTRKDLFYRGPISSATFRDRSKLRIFPLELEGMHVAIKKLSISAGLKYTIVMVFN